MFIVQPELSLSYSRMPKRVRSHVLALLIFLVFYLRNSLHRRKPSQRWETDRATVHLTPLHSYIFLKLLGPILLKARHHYI